MAAQYTGTHISGAGTTHVSLVGGVLHTVVINSKGTLCTVQTTEPTPVVKAIIDTSVAPGTLLYDLEFNMGLDVITTGAGTDITVTFQ